MIEIRAANPDDAMAIARVHVEAWRVGYAGLLPDGYLRALRPEDRAAGYRFHGKRHETLLAVEGTLVTGFIQVGLPRDEAAPDEGEVSALYVHPDAWRSGVGRALMAAGRARMLDNGCTGARLWVMTGNERAEAFYRADGWNRQKDTRSEMVWALLIDEVLFTRSLP